MNIYTFQPDDELFSDFKEWSKDNTFNPFDYNNLPIPKERHFWYGMKHSESTKRKMSISAKGKIRTKEHLENISKATKGKKRKCFTDEHKLKISNALKNVKKPHMKQETKDKISKSCSKGNHYSAIPVTLDGVTYSCKKEVIEKLNISKHNLNKLLSSYLS